MGPREYRTEKGGLGVSPRSGDGTGSDVSSQFKPKGADEKDGETRQQKRAGLTPSARARVFLFPGRNLPKASRVAYTFKYFHIR